MTTLPPPQQGVILRDVTHHEYPSRVVRHEGDLIALARPTGFAAPPGFGVGFRVEVTWPGERGVLTLPVEVVEVHGGAEPVWLARPRDATRPEQRRSFVRVSVAGTLTLQYEGATHPATLVDVSEAGLRTMLTGGPDLAVGTRLRAGFSLDGTGFLVDAEVLRLLPADERGSRALVLVFALAERTAAALRRAVFSEQIRQRHAGAPPTATPG